MGFDRIDIDKPLGRVGRDPAADLLPVKFTIGTLVNNRAQYDRMIESFRRGGFTSAGTEFLFIDNTGGTQTCAYRGLNQVLAAARGTYVVMCHQDVRVLGDHAGDLERLLRELDGRDPNWALAGNAGGVAPGELALRISDPHGSNQNTGPLPRRVMSLDENFIVVRRTARVGFSADLTGFHLYGADICLNADVAGYHSYVIDFHLAHLSPGTKTQAFFDAEAAFCAKWNRALASRWMQTTCTLVRVSGSSAGHMAGRIAAAPYAKFVRRLPHLKAIRDDFKKLLK